MGGIVPFTYLAHVLAVAAAVLVLVWCIHFRGGLSLQSSNKSLIFNVHPVLMLIGFIILGGEATMCYKALPWRKESKKIVHLLLHGIALVLGSVGIYSVFKYHNESGIANVYSLHSWVGIGVFSLYGFQWILGFITFFFPGTKQSVRQSVIPWHAMFGLFIFVLAVGNAELGFLEKLTFLEIGGLSKYGSEALLVNFTALVVILLGASVVISTASTVTARNVQPDDNQKSISF